MENVCPVIIRGIYMLYFLKKIKATIQTKICVVLKMMQLLALLNAMAIDNLFPVSVNARMALMTMEQTMLALIAITLGLYYR